MGLDLDFVKGDGPRIGNPIASTRDVDLLGTPPAAETMAGTLEAIRLVRAELEPRGVPVIGFAGAPFTLASYAIEGGTSRDFTKTKAFMLSEPAAWKRLLGKLVTVQADYLLAQARGRRGGAAGLRLLGRPRARSRGLPALRRAAQPRAVREGRRCRRARDQLLARCRRVSGGSGRVRRGRRRTRLDASARRGLGAGRLRPAGAGKSRPGVAARTVARARVPDRRRARPRGRTARARLQRRPRAHARRRPSTTCGGSSSTCGSGRRV